MPANGGARSTLAWCGAFAGLVGVALLMMVRADGRVPDDAYIFFRYAENLVDGHGWTYNVASETGNGATSPLWTVLLAGGRLLHDDTETVAWVLYATALAGAGLVTAASLRALGRPVAGAVAAVALVVNPTLLWVRGMESALFLLLLAAALHLGVVRRRPAATGVAIGLLMLARPEGAILGIAVGLLAWRRDRRPPWLMAGLAAAVVAPWVVFSAVVFGEPVAGTMQAKIAQGRSGYWGGPFEFLRYVGTVVRNPWSVVLLVTAPLGAWFGLRHRRTRAYTGVLAGTTIVQLAIYGLVLRPPAYLWYYALAYLAATVGFALVVDVASSAVGSRTPVPPTAVAATATVGLLALCLAGQIRGDSYPGYRTAGRWLDRSAAPTQRVAAAEIGVLGWTSGQPIVDYLGLLDARSADEVRRGDLATWLGRTQPEFVVVHAPAWELELPSLALPWFGRAYTPVAEVSGPPASRVRVFERVRSLPQATAAADGTLLTPTVRAALADRGVPDTPSGRSAIEALLGLHLARSDLQARFEDADGVDLAGLVAWGAASGDSRLADHRAALRSLARAIGDGTLVTPLAPWVPSG